VTSKSRNSRRREGPQLGLVHVGGKILDPYRIGPPRSPLSLSYVSIDYATRIRGIGWRRSASSSHLPCKEHTYEGSGVYGQEGNGDAHLMAQPEETVIRPGHGLRNFWRDLWHYRELFYFLAWRDIAVRYKQTAIGVSWSVVRPLLTMLVFTIVFNRLAHLHSSGVPYSIFVFAGLLPWTFISSAVTESSNSLITNVNMVSKIYFPRLILPTTAVIVGLMDLLISFGVFTLLMLFFQFPPSPHLLALPLFIAMAICIAIGAGLWLAALNVKYRDFRYVVPFVMQLGTYISPVGFSSTLVPDRWQIVYSLNPVVGVIDGFRWSIIGGSQPLLSSHLAASLFATIAVLAGGLWYFQRAERSFADVI
jgi:lipopolysaccharide transport system permease protein